MALGQLYYFGARGMEQSYAEALKWYLLVSNNSSISQSNSSSRAVQSCAEPLKWYLLVRNNGGIRNREALRWYLRVSNNSSVSKSNSSSRAKQRL